MMEKLAQHMPLNERSAVAVALEQTTVHPGEVLRGVVRLSVTKPFDSTALVIRAKGTQHLVWLTAAEKRVIAHAKAQDHYKNEHECYHETRSFDVGEYTFPFAFELPVDLQPNFSYVAKAVADLQAVRVAVEHSVAVHVHVQGASKADLSAKSVFIVQPLPVPRPLEKRIIVSESQPIKFMGMWKSGVCTASMEIDTDLFDHTSTIEARVNFRLETKLKLAYVMLELVEDASVNRYDPFFTKNTRGHRVVCCRRLDRNAIDLLLGSPPSSPLTEGAGSVALTLRLPITPNDVSEFEPLNPTMTAHFVGITYAVRVVCKLSMAPSIKIAAPITIVRADPLESSVAG